MKMIFALGNPETRYEYTRHNLGWLTIDAIAERAGATPWKFDKKHNADIATATHGDEKVLFAKPHTYYNEVGQSAQSLVQFYKLDPRSDMLVVHDDLAIPIGTLRTRGTGGDAGNNGIKSINAHLGRDYPRLRIGIWSPIRDLVDDADFVLARFPKEELFHVKKTIIPGAFPFVDTFLDGNFAADSAALPLQQLDF